MQKELYNCHSCEEPRKEVPRICKRCNAWLCSACPGFIVYADGIFCPVCDTHGFIPFPGLETLLEYALDRLDMTHTELLDEWRRENNNKKRKITCAVCNQHTTCPRSHQRSTEAGVWGVCCGCVENDLECCP